MDTHARHGERILYGQVADDFQKNVKQPPELAARFVSCESWHEEVSARSFVRE
jgi:hypothetical protein